MQRYVAVVGSGTCSAQEAAAAEQIGSLLARAGAVVVCGGLSGVMEAACRGARREGGLTVGILPGSERSAANSHVAVAIAADWCSRSRANVPWIVGRRAHRALATSFRRIDFASSRSIFATTRRSL